MSTMLKLCCRKFKSYNVILDFLYILGVPGMKRKEQWQLTLLHLISITIMHIGHLHILVLDGGVLNYCNDFQCSKITFSIIMWRLLLLANWYSIYFKRKEVKDLLSAIEMLQKERNKKLFRTLNVINGIFVLVLLVYVYLIVRGSSGIILWPDSNKIDSMFHKLAFGLGTAIQIPVKAAFIFLFHFFTWPFIYLCPLLLSLFYTSWCFVLSRQLKEIGDQLADLSQSSSSNSRRLAIGFINNYGDMYQLAGLSESALSTQVFWLCSSHFLLLFRLFSKLLFVYTYIPITLVNDSVVPVLQSLCFFAISYSASEVSHQDGVVRERAEDAAFRMELAKDTKDCGEILAKFVRSRKPLIFSACGMFDFTKGFLLASSGVLISYNLLILQLNTSTGN